jgi:hypothetical protein
MPRIHLPRTSRLSALTPALGAVAAIAMVGTAPVASAHDTYVDHTDGSNASTQCRRASPCATIGRGVDKAGRADTIFVGGDPVAFTTPVTLGNGKSLVHRDFSTDPAIDTSGPVYIDSGSDPRPAITVASNAGVIRDLFINSASTALEIQASVAATDNVFLEEDAMSGPVIDIAPDAHGKAAIKDNSIYDTTPVQGVTQVGISNRSATAPLISGNTLGDFTTAISTEGRPRIRGNFIKGTHPGGSFTGTGIIVRHGSRATLSGNQLYNPDTSGNPVTGILVLGNAGFKNNLVFDYDTGVELKDTPKPVEFSGDVIRTIAGGSVRGLVAIDSTDSPGVSDPHATNVTIVGPGTQIGLDSVRLRLDSSIVGDTPGSVMSLSGGSTCNITYSRSQHTGNPTDGCANFQTTKDPLFKPDGYHLRRVSPLIDKGNPDVPPRQARDLDGDRRALDGPDGGNCHGAARRDIGADEYAC